VEITLNLMTTQLKLIVALAGLAVKVVALNLDCLEYFVGMLVRLSTRQR
jgi:hypothetical protein